MRLGLLGVCSPGPKGSHGTSMWGETHGELVAHEWHVTMLHASLKVTTSSLGPNARAQRALPKSDVEARVGMSLPPFFSKQGPLWGVGIVVTWQESVPHIIF